ncbi:MAG: c-type cytochrome [Phycisphaerales bacterium]|nr:c-type cytochrome [Phycisphaerales bacterium]
MNTKLLIAGFAGTTGLLACAFANDINFDGRDMVEPDCDVMSDWYECRDIETAPAGVYLGYQYMHLTSETLGPDGNTVYADTGEPYVTTVTSCSSCHFSGGQVPFGSPVYQSPSKYTVNPVTGLGPYFRPLGYHRDLEDSIIDCFRNCMNAERAPAKDDPVMIALVEYIQWVADGVIDPAARENWDLLPPEAGPRLPVIDGVSLMRADPIRGGQLYANSCADCHSEDGPGAGEYRVGEPRPRIPALWGDRDGYSKGAAFYRTPVLGAYIQKHMPLDDPMTLSNQDAIDIAAFINAPDKARPSGMADQMYTHDDPDGIPSSLRKPADWLVGFEYPGERAHFESMGIDYEDMILNGPWNDLSQWRSDEINRLLSCSVDLNQDQNLDFFDISAFLDAFVTQAAIADWNSDGNFDFFDVSAFLNAFMRGCP